jgi:hypothetical protein
MVLVLLVPLVLAAGTGSALACARLAACHY